LHIVTKASNVFTNDNKSVQQKIDDFTSHLADFVSVKNYGATGLGIADDSEAIQTALDDCEGKTLIFPAGVYYIGNGAELRPPNNIKIVGYNATIKFGEERTKSAFRVYSKENIVFSGLNFDGNFPDGSVSEYPQSAHGIRIESGKNIIIEKCNFTNMPSDAVYMRRDNLGGEYGALDGDLSSNITVRNCTIHNCKRNGIAVVAGKNITIDNNKITDDGVVGWWQASPINIEPNNPEDHIDSINVANNYIYCETIPTQIRQSITTVAFELIRNTLIINNKVYGIIHVEGRDIATNVIIEKNYNLKEGGENGIWCARVKKNVTIRDNFTNTTTDRAIHVSYCQNNVLIENNICKPLLGHGIRLHNCSVENGYGHNFKIMKNSIEAGDTSVIGIEIRGSSNHYLPRQIFLDHNYIIGCDVSINFDRANYVFVEHNYMDGYITALNHTPTTYFYEGNAINGIMPVGNNYPTSGTWIRGMKIYNATPTAGGYAGWVCIASGTPGTWKGFGEIDV